MGCGSAGPPISAVVDPIEGLETFFLRRDDVVAELLRDDGLLRLLGDSVTLEILT